MGALWCQLCSPWDLGTEWAVGTRQQDGAGGVGQWGIGVSRSRVSVSGFDGFDKRRKRWSKSMGDQAGGEWGGRGPGV